MQLGTKFDGVQGGKKKNQWDRAPWEVFDYIVGFITNKDKKDLWEAGKALYRYIKHGNPKPVDNRSEVNPQLEPTEEELAQVRESIKDLGLQDGRDRVLVYGMRKYALNNWQFVKPFRIRYFAAV